MAVVLDSGFEIVYCGRSDYDEMAMEIWYYHEPIIEINKEKGENLMEVRILNQTIFTDRVKDHYFNLENFLQALEMATQMLIECGSTALFIEGLTSS